MTSSSDPRFVRFLRRRSARSRIRLSMQKHTLSYELELRPGIFEIGTFKLQLLGAPLVRVTIGREQRGARLAFKLLRGQALAESLMLSSLGGAAGLLLGWAGTRALVRLQPGGMK